MKNIILSQLLVLIFIFNYNNAVEAAELKVKPEGSATVLTPGCSSYVHPCSSQASTVQLKDKTRAPASAKPALPTAVESQSGAR